MYPFWVVELTISVLDTDILATWGIQKSYLPPFYLLLSLRSCDFLLNSLVKAVITDVPILGSRIAILVSRYGQVDQLDNMN